MSGQSAVSLRPQLASGALSARALADACLERIAAREPEIHAFAHIDPDHVRHQADALDEHRKAGRPIGPLHGIPVALKDIADTADYPTENGSILDAGRRPKRDATFVAKLRAAGAVILGKTVTTEFAFRSPGPTRNPHNLSHTPGGSSQGSAAAVADGMVPIAIGSQTVGSTVRPASFCGVVGLKPSHGAVSLAGCLATAHPLDTVGVFATTLADAALTVTVMQGYDPADPRTRAVAHADLLDSAQTPPPRPPSIAIVEGPFWSEAAPEMKGLIADVANALGGLDTAPLPDAFQDAYPAHLTLMNAGFTRHLGHYRDRGADAISKEMLDAMAQGDEVRAVDYLAALDCREALIGGLDGVFDRYDAVLTPPAPGEAPLGLTNTGDSRFNALWTFTGAPALNLPVGRGPNGLPMGVQLVGRPGEDAKLMRTAAWVAARLSG